MKTDLATIVANGERKQVRLPSTVSDFLGSCGWKPTQVVVEYNGEVLARNQLDTVKIQSGDCLEVIVPVAGG